MECVSLQDSLENNEKDKKVRAESLFFTVFILTVIPKDT